MHMTKWRPLWPGLDLRLDAELKRVIGASTIMLASLGMLVLLVQRFEAPFVLVVLLLGLGFVGLLVWPEAATVLTVFLLYINFPAILTKQLGMNEIVASTFMFLLAIPLAHLMLVRRMRLRTDVTFWLMVAYLAVLLLTSLGAVESSVALENVKRYIFEGLLLYWIILNVIHGDQVLRRCIWAMLAAGSLVASLSLYQEVTGSYRNEFGGLAYRHLEEPNPDEQVQSSRRKWDRAQGPVDEPNRFAQVLIVLVPLAMWSYREARSRGARLLALTAGLLVLGCIGITMSRGAFVALVILGIAMVFAKWARPATMITCLAGLVLALSVASPQYAARVLSILNAKYLAAGSDTQIEQADGAIRGRMTSMLTALHVFRDHPLLGVGPGQFRFHYMKTYKSNPQTSFRDNIRAPRRAHSLYLEIAAETGALGLAVFMAIMLNLVRELWRMRRVCLNRSLGLADLPTAFALGILMYLMTGVFLHLSYQRYCWLYVALASAAVHVVRSQLQAAATSPGTMTKAHADLRLST